MSVEPEREVRWSEPPPDPRDGLLPWFFDQLRERPEEWAEWPRPNQSALRSQAKRVRRSDYSAQRKGERWEATTRQTDGMECMWVRFMGTGRAKKAT